MLFAPMATALIALIFRPVAGKANAEIIEVEFRGTEIQRVVSPEIKVDKNPIYLEVAIENIDGRTFFHEKLQTSVGRPPISIEAGKTVELALQAVTWSIIGPNKFQRVDRTFSYDLISVGTITGETCEVTNTYKLHPGQSHYILTDTNKGVPVVASHLQLEVTSCLVRRNKNRTNPSE